MNEAKLREVLMRFLMEFGTDDVLWLRVSKSDWYTWGSQQIETDGLLSELDIAGWMKESFGSDRLRYTRLTPKALAFIKGENHE